MTPFQMPAHASNHSLSGTTSVLSAVKEDMRNLAQHMAHCAASRGRMFKLQAAAQAIHALASPRVVTVLSAGTLIAVVTVSLAFSLGLIAPV